MFGMLVIIWHFGGSKSWFWLVFITIFNHFEILEVQNHGFGWFSLRFSIILRFWGSKIMVLIDFHYDFQSFWDFGGPKSWFWLVFITIFNNFEILEVQNHGFELFSLRFSIILGFWRSKIMVLVGFHYDFQSFWDFGGPKSWFWLVFIMIFSHFGILEGQNHCFGWFSLWFSIILGFWRSKIMVLVGFHYDFQSFWDFGGPKSWFWLVFITIFNHFGILESGSNIKWNTTGKQQSKSTPSNQSTPQPPPPGIPGPHTLIRQSAVCT